MIESIIVFICIILMAALLCVAMQLPRIPGNKNPPKVRGVWVPMESNKTFHYDLQYDDTAILWMYADGKWSNMNTNPNWPFFSTTKENNAYGVYMSAIYGGLELIDMPKPAPDKNWPTDTDFAVEVIRA